MKTVLIVDASPVMRGGLAQGLAGLGVRVETAGSGLEALSAFDRLAPDLVVLDRFLPDLDALHLVGALREENSAALPPIILLTSEFDASDSHHAMLLGISDLILKSETPLPAIVEIVREHLAAGRPTARALGGSQFTPDPPKLAQWATLARR